MSLESIAIITGILFLASLGMPISTATAMSGHSLGKKVTPAWLNWLIVNFGFGVFLINSLLISSVCLSIIDLEKKFGAFYQQPDFKSLIIVLLTIQLLIMLALMIVNPVQNPWSSQRFKKFLLKRSNKTKSSAEAISLGIASVLANFWLALLPMIMLASYIINQNMITTILLISLASTSSIFGLFLLIRHRIKVDSIHQSLIKNRRFNQFMTISLLSILILLLLLILMVK